MFGLLISSLTVNAVNPGRIVSDILDNEKPSSMKVFPSPNRFIKNEMSKTHGLAFAKVSVY